MEYDFRLNRVFLEFISTSPEENSKEILVEQFFFLEFERKVFDLDGDLKIDF